MYYDLQIKRIDGDDISKKITDISNECNNFSYKDNDEIGLCYEIETVHGKMILMSEKLLKNLYETIEVLETGELHEIRRAIENDA